MKLCLRELSIESLRDFRRTWPQLILTDLVVRVAAVVVLAPAVGLLVRLFLTTTATGVVADAAIVNFLFHPIGIAALLTVGAVSLGLLFAETGALMVIGFGAVEDRRVTWLDALRYALRRVAVFVHVAWFAVGRLLLIVLPFLAAVGALYWLLLREYDINYYLTQKPPEFWIAVIGAGLVLTVAAILVLRRIAGWLLALPLVLFEGVGGKRALHASEVATTSDRRRIMSGLVVWLVALALLSTLVTFTVGLFGDLLIPRNSSSVALLLAGLGTVLVVSGLANFAITVFATVLFPLMVVRVYRSLAGPGDLSPVSAASGSLGGKPARRVPGKAVLGVGAAVLVVVVVIAYLALRDAARWVQSRQGVQPSSTCPPRPQNLIAMPS